MRKKKLFVRCRLLSALLCAALLLPTLALPARAATAAEAMQAAVAILTGKQTQTAEETQEAGKTEGTEKAETTEQTGQTGQTQQTAGARTLQTNFGQVTVTNSSTQSSGKTSSSRVYTFPEDTSVTMTRITPASATAGSLDTTTLPGKFQYAVWLDESTDEWKSANTLGEVPNVSVLFVTTDEVSAILYAPMVYETRENQMLEEVTDAGTRLTLGQTQEGVSISWYAAKVPAGAYVECLRVVSATALVDWNDKEQAGVWKSLLLTGDNRWTYDGYYYRTPSTYIPSGENYFHRIPAPYIVIKMLDIPASYGAKVMSVAMLDVMLELMNDEGYYPTWAQSSWLLEDYGIDAGYFDTRWNADMTLGLLDAYDLYGVEEFKTYAVKNGQYWLSQLAKHTVSYTGESASGLLLEDYWGDGQTARTHTSLNHQLAATLMLYRLGDLTGNTAYSTAAGQLLAGIRAVGMQWVKEDGNLWYRIDPDGTLTGVDYPTLTYDDLYKLQDYLQSSKRGADATLTVLMYYKRGWMDANGVTDYLK